MCLLMSAVYWQLRHAVPALDRDVTTTAFMDLKRTALLAAAPDLVQPSIRPVNPLSKLLEQLFSFSDDFCYPGPPP